MKLKLLVLLVLVGIGSFAVLKSRPVPNQVATKPLAPVLPDSEKGRPSQRPSVDGDTPVAASLPKFSLPTLGQVEVKNLETVNVYGKVIKRGHIDGPVQVGFGVFPAGSVLDFDVESGALLSVKFPGTVEFDRVKIRDRLQISHGKNPGFELKLAEDYDNAGVLPTNTVVKAWVDDLKSPDLFFTVVRPTKDFIYRGHELRAGESYILDPATGNLEDLSD